MPDNCCNTVILQEEVISVIIAPAEQGPPGTGINVDDFFQVANNFSELDTAEKKVAARENLELQYIDCGTFN